MATEYRDVFTFVQHLAPTWRKSQHEVMAQVVRGLLERPTLCETEIARSLPPGPGARADCSLHSRLKRLERFLANPRLDEGAIFVRCLSLACHCAASLPHLSQGELLLPLLLDSTYFQPCAALIVSAPCGGRALPIIFTTYDRYSLHACFPPEHTWPNPDTALCPLPAKRGRAAAGASAQVAPWLSQNLIEQQLLDYLYSCLPPGLLAVVVADRGFARATLMQWLRGRKRSFVIRFDGDTWLRLPDGRTGPAHKLLALKPGQRQWLPHAHYGQQEQVPVAVLALWEQGHKEPWYLASDLTDAEMIDTLYHWRMRAEQGYRDEKSGVILREGGDRHQLKAVLHLHRLLLANFLLHWLAALTGLQAHHDLPQAQSPQDDQITAPAPTPLEQAPPYTPQAAHLLNQGPAQPPPVIPHRGHTPTLARWLRRFAVRGHLRATSALARRSCASVTWPHSCAELSIGSELALVGQGGRPDPEPG
ncbi:MAG: transposase [Anaerolineae bacterium]